MTQNSILLIDDSASAGSSRRWFPNAVPSPGWHVVLQRLILSALLLLPTVMAGCGPIRHSGSFKRTGAMWVVTVRLQRSHLYLAEYSRTLSLQLAEDKESTVALFPDTGGYTRVNLYQFGPGELLVKTMGNEEYHLRLDSGEIVTENISVWHKGEKRPGHTGSFIGAFDWDEGRHWRFIPFSERAEISVGEP